MYTCSDLDSEKNIVYFDDEDNESDDSADEKPKESRFIKAATISKLVEIASQTYGVQGTTHSVHPYT